MIIDEDLIPHRADLIPHKTNRSSIPMSRTRDNDEDGHNLLPVAVRDNIPIAHSAHGDNRPVQAVQVLFGIAGVLRVACNLIGYLWADVCLGFMTWASRRGQSFKSCTVTPKALLSND